MSSSSSIQSRYLKFIENQMDRLANAYRRSANGSYSAGEMFSDCSEFTADVVSMTWGPVKDILDSEARWELSAAPNATNVMDSRRYTLSGSETLTTQPFQSGGEADIPFTAAPDASKLRIQIHIPNVGNAASGKVFTGSIIDTSGAGSTIATLKLTIT